MIDSQRTLLDARTLLAEARVAREKRLADLENLAGADVETLGASTPSPTSAPAWPPSTQPVSR
jgi:outer membrane protein, heavy metal efflux system